MKNILKKYRNKFLSIVLEPLSELNIKLDKLSIESQAQTKQILAIAAKLDNSRFLRLEENEIIAKIFSGAKMYLDPRDRALVPHLIIDGEWERDVTNAWLSTVKENSTILDIGANFGYFGVLAIQQTKRKCNVIFFEANPEIIPYLRKTISVNSFDAQATIENYAVSNKQGSVKLNIFKDYIGCSSILESDKLTKQNKKKSLDIARTPVVRAITVDKYCEEKGIKEVDFIKMDIEGHEEKAYMGMRNVIKNSKAITMFIEFTEESYDNPKQFYEQMLSDFTYIYTISKEGTLTKHSNNSYDRIIKKNDDWTMLVFSKKPTL